MGFMDNAASTSNKKIKWLNMAEHNFMLFYILREMVSNFKQFVSMLSSQEISDGWFYEFSSNEDAIVSNRRK